MPTLTELLTECCDAIRERGGTTEQISPDDMAACVADIVSEGFDVSRYSGIKFFNDSIDTEMDLQTLDTSGFTDMLGMFQGCTNLARLDISGFDTSNVMTMKNMFTGCRTLDSVDVSSFTTSNVEDMSLMFQNCAQLATLDLASFDTANVATMASMFMGCAQLATLDLASFDTANVTTMENMFRNMVSLTSLNLQSFDTRTVTTMTSFIDGCSNLTDVIFAINFTSPDLIGAMPLPHANVWDKVTNTVPTDLNIYVRTSQVTAYQWATNWNRYMSCIKPISQLPLELQELYNIDPNDYN